MPKNKVRDRLVYLCEKVACDHEIDISQDPENEGDVSSESLSAYGIRLLDLDVESIDDAEANLAFDPPILFKPLPISEVERFPPTSVKREYRDYIAPEARSPDNRRGWRPVHCARAVFYYILSLCDGFQTNLPEPFDRLMEYCELRPITVPNPYLYGAQPPSSIQGGKCCWGIELECAMVNGKPTSPYVAQATLHYYNGREGSILWGELAVLITAMCNRATQPDIDIQTWGAYSERGYILREEIGNRLAFPKEKRFPVVMLSFVGPQHGRIFYACMDGEQLVIRQSKLLSFEQEANAPIALFQRILLSRPIAEA